MIELRHLSHLLVACQHDNLTRAADDLHLAASTLSASLKALETELGYSLFNRSGAGLYPRTGARWLFRAGLPLLLLERHALRRLKTAGAPQVLNIRIGLKFTIGRASKALLRAIAETEAADPLLLVHPVWIDDSACPFDSGWETDLGLHPAGTMPGCWPIAWPATTPCRPISRHAPFWFPPCRAAFPKPSKRISASAGSAAGGCWKIIRARCHG
jgi:hypothetical protein